MFSGFKLNVPEYRLGDFNVRMISKSNIGLMQGKTTDWENKSQTEFQGRRTFYRPAELRRTVGKEKKPKPHDLQKGRSLKTERGMQNDKN